YLGKGHALHQSVLCAATASVLRLAPGVKWKCGWLRPTAEKLHVRAASTRSARVSRPPVGGRPAQFVTPRCLRREECMRTPQRMQTPPQGSCRQVPRSCANPRRSEESCLNACRINIEHALFAAGERARTLRVVHEQTSARGSSPDGRDRMISYR